MDKEFIREILSTEDGTSDKLIKDGDFIDSELLEILGKSSRKNLQKAFYSYKGSMPNGGYKYLVELKCPVCNAVHKKIVSKTKLMQILGYSSSYSCDYYIYHCEKCKSEEEMKAKIKQEEWHVQCEEKSKMRTEQYICDYLNPNSSFKPYVKAGEKIKYIMGKDYFNNEDEIKVAVRSMNYHDFLKTPYWDGVRSYKLERAKYRCELCNGEGILNVHHKTYEHHGLEHLRTVADKDLIVLCKDCHEKFHDKLADKEVLA